MTISVSVTNNERAGHTVYVDTHHREPGGSAHPRPVATHAIEPGEARTFTLHAARVLVLRETPPIPVEGA